MGHKADGHWLGWALGGAFFALAASTLILGLCDSALIPLSHDEDVSLQVKSVLLACLPILLVGGNMILADRKCAYKHFRKKKLPICCHRRTSLAIASFVSRLKRVISGGLFHAL